MHKKTDLQVFLPKAEEARKKRLIIMISQQQYELLNGIAGALGRNPGDLIYHSFENLILPGIIREAEELKLTTTAEMTSKAPFQKLNQLPIKEE